MRTQRTRKKGYPDRFVNADALTALLKGRFRIRSWLAALLIVGALNAPIIVAAAMNDLWLSTPNRVGLLQDYSWWIFNISSIPATVLGFLWMPDGITSVLEGLVKNRAVVLPQSQEGDNNEFTAFVTRFDQSYSHWAWALLGFIGVTVYMLFMSIPVQREYKNWQTSGSFIFWYTVFFWIVVFLIGSLVVVRGVIAIVWFNRLFKEFEMDVRVLHPDGAGGLSPLGGFSVKIGYLIGIYGIAAVAGTLSESYVLTTRFSGLLLTPAVLPLLVVYLLLSPIAFFAPIGAAHSAMKAAKDAFILQIADQFEIDAARLASLLDADPAKLKKGLEKIEQLQRIHRIASRFPVWPFNTESLVRFFSSVLSPVMFGLISILVDLLK